MQRGPNRWLWHRSGACMYVCMHTYMYVYICMCICIYVYVYIYTYMYIYIHKKKPVTLTSQRRVVDAAVTPPPAPYREAVLHASKSRPCRLANCWIVAWTWGRARAYRMCSVTTECVLLPWNMCFLCCVEMPWASACRPFYGKRTHSVVREHIL